MIQEMRRPCIGKVFGLLDNVKVIVKKDVPERMIKKNLVISNI